MRLLIDVDGVLADFVYDVLTRLYKDSHPRIDSSQVGSDWLYDHLTKKEQRAASAIINRPGFAQDMNPLLGAREVVDVIRENGWDVYIVTSPWLGSRTWCWDRSQWLQREFDINPKNVVFTHKKSLVGADVLIEDTLNHLEEWKKENPAGLPLFHHLHHPLGMTWKDLGSFDWYGMNTLQLGVNQWRSDRR